MNSFAPAAVGGRPPFTATQWQELQHQALIWKYLIAGVPVPPELIIPIRRSFEALPGRYYHPSLSYYYYGKKPDPEPGRCRRTDGKKWRCSKDAYPGSKYCERHMHRGRNRSRKPVESQTISPSQTSSSTLTSLSPSGSNASGSGVGSFRSINLQSIAGQNNAQSSSLGGASSSQLPMDTSTLGNRYYSEFKPNLDEHSFFSEASGTARALGMDSSLSVDSSWNLMTPQVSLFPLSKTQDLPILQNAYPQLQSAQDLGQVTFSSLSRQHHQQPYPFFRSNFGSSEPTKQETQFLRPFFDEWPKARDSWSDLDEDRSNRTSFSTTQLSISIPMASSDFSSTSSRSPNGKKTSDFGGSNHHTIAKDYHSRILSPQMVEGG